jgi:predicted Zn-dependent protease
MAQDALIALALAACLAGGEAGPKPPAGQDVSPAGQSPAADLAARADAARRADRPDDAIPLYRKALAQRPAWAEGWFHLGALLYGREAHAEAAAALRRATRLAPKVGTAWALLGLCEYRLGQHAPALDHLRRGRSLGVSADPQFRQVLRYHEGLLLVHAAEFERAQEVLDELSADGLESEELLLAQGLAALRMRPEELPAVASPERALAIAAGRAQTLAARKRFDEARRAYEQLTAEHPRRRHLQYALGRHFVRTQQPEQAAAAFAREIANSPDHVPARLGLAAIRAQDDPAAARRLAEEAVRLNPRIPLGHYLLGTLLLEAGELQPAIVALETAERSVKEDPGVYYALSRAYARAGRTADAEKARATFTRLNEARQAAARRVPDEERP